MSKFVPTEDPPPYNQINPQAVPQMQATPATVPTYQPVILHTVQPQPQQPVIFHQVQPQPQQPVISTIQIVHPGCRHDFRAEFTLCGILCDIFFFPIGFLCCICMMQPRCRHCRLYA